METVTVALANQSYPIYIGHDFLSDIKKILAPFVQSQQIIIISNSTIAPLYLSGIKKQFESECTHRVLDFCFPDGEKYKNLETVSTLFDFLLENKINRSCTLIALGGGVIGDMVGFAASCYQRGVNFIQIPTSLLAQVDASVGGKTAVNHPLGKNMIGAFYQPKCVLMDISLLQTLDNRQFNSGLAEMIKMGLLFDESYLNYLENNITFILDKKPEYLIPAIKVSCELKARVVAEDERESGCRALLNLGHTFAHAIESLTQYEMYLHGEAVSIGLLMALDLSIKENNLDPMVYQRVEKLLHKINLPTRTHFDLAPKAVYDLMLGDKKNQTNQCRLVLLKKIGQADLTESVSREKIIEAIQNGVGTE